VKIVQKVVDRWAQEHAKEKKILGQFS